MKILYYFLLIGLINTLSSYSCQEQQGHRRTKSPDEILVARLIAEEENPELQATIKDISQQLLSKNGYQSWSTMRQFHGDDTCAQLYYTAVELAVAEYYRREKQQQFERGRQFLVE
jgi:hypothetical protein